MRTFSAAALGGTIVCAVAVMWVNQLWPTVLAEVLAFILAGAWMAAFVAGRYRPRLTLAFLPLAVGIVWGVVQIRTGTTIYPWRTLTAVLFWSANLAFFFAAVQTFSDSALRNRFLRALLWFGFAICVISTLQALTVNAKVFWLFQTEFTKTNVFGPFVYHNQYAAFVELILPIALYYSLVDKNLRFVYALMAAAMYASVVASGSRAGFVLTSAELVWVPLATVRGRGLAARPVLRGAAFVAGIAVVLSLLAGPDLLVSKLSNADPFSYRRELNYASLAMIKARPLRGFGLGTWPTAYPGYAVVDTGLFANQAHDDWAQWAVEGGLPFVALMLLLALWGIPKGLRVRWGAGIAAVFLHCAVDYPTQQIPLTFILFALMAAAATPVQSEPRGKRAQAGSSRL